MRDRRSYAVVNSLRLSARMDLVVWKKSGYRDVTTELCDRHFRIDLEDLAARK